jgi:hypothetical protein
MVKETYCSCCGIKRPCKRYIVELIDNNIARLFRIQKGQFTVCEDCIQEIRDRGHALVVSLWD